MKRIKVVVSILDTGYSRTFLFFLNRESRCDDLMAIYCRWVCISFILSEEIQVL